VLAVLAALNPMKEVGPVRIDEVQDVLHERLTDLITPPSGRRYGKLLVAAIDAARGFGFEVVFVPGLAERMFPQKLVEDPLLLDAARAQLPFDLPTREQRLRDERLALRLAIGAATRRVVLSYPRIDLDQGRPRVPSFYGLEVLQAAEGALPGFDELGRRADMTGAVRVGWPAPKDPQEAIDEAEFDLGVLDELVDQKTGEKGQARYLLAANKHLARALRTRARRWLKSWKAWDGLILSDAMKPLLADHQAAARSFSPTTLEALAACPYRFALKTIVKLEPREEPEPIETLDPLERGALIHEVQFELLVALRDAGELPVRQSTLDAARDRLDAVLDKVADEYRDKLYPAIDRVWNDGIAGIRADLREWLRRMAEDIDWTPRRFELAFGLDRKDGRDPASQDEAVQLDIGLQLRGSIDLVEQRGDGTLRATDHKTGKARVDRNALIAGGRSLQPTLYALALEKMFPDAMVQGGRLYYCTTRGDFSEVTVVLDDEARYAAKTLAGTLSHCLDKGFFPAAPAKDECKYCDYKRVCGPYEEMRAKLKETNSLRELEELRKTR
jgi:RecB family exonuclease